jgi:hypothetical protein
MANNPNKPEGLTLQRFPVIQHLDKVRQRKHEIKMRRRVEERLRKDRQAFLLVARILDIE